MTTVPISKRSVPERIALQRRFIHYSLPECDGTYFYRYVLIPPEWEDFFPRGLLRESQFASLGINMTPGWEHYALLPHESMILLFRKYVYLDPQRLESFEQNALAMRHAEAEAILHRKLALQMVRNRSKGSEARRLDVSDAA